ncbi:MAG: thioredoxin family protein [Luteimonas sp.]|nr:thioredoxin family protein [Luteimonas sp.]
MTTRRALLASVIAGSAVLRHGAIAAARGDELTFTEFPPLDGATAWLGSPPLTTTGLRGKVVLVQFWTYSCINWLRSLPYVRAWAENYWRQGLVVIGIHTPEFEFEKSADNVLRAVKEMAVPYPVALDSEAAIWRAFDNHYWPALYLIDPRGQVRHHHFGEGDYEQTEGVIRQLLFESGLAGIATGRVSVVARGAEAAADWENLKSPENYLGHMRTENFASPGGMARDKPRVYSAPPRLGINQWALIGEWTLQAQFAAPNRPTGRIACRFQARDLHLVMGPAPGERPVRFRVRIDGQAPGADHGLDVDPQGEGTATWLRLYQLVRQNRPGEDRLFEIEFLDSGVRAFSFTFG